MYTVYILITFMFSSPTKNFEHTIIDKTSWRNTAKLFLLENHNFPNRFSPSPISMLFPL